MFGQSSSSKNAKNSGVACTVTNCAYHGAGNSCNARNIKVGTEYALDKTETFCSTFESRPEN
ncbi:MAG: DUF1540 domain-containing protein [Oscillospiraceae bacterium]|nr:DUF1540 domain-containing protein [Oscillospiraceae bacterium]